MALLMYFIESNTHKHFRNLRVSLTGRAITTASMIACLSAHRFWYEGVTIEAEHVNARPCMPHSGPPRSLPIANCPGTEEALPGHSSCEHSKWGRLGMRRRDFTTVLVC